jgi:hypothetical protein
MYREKTACYTVVLLFESLGAKKVYFNEQEDNVKNHYGHACPVVE